MKEYKKLLIFNFYIHGYLIFQEQSERLIITTVAIQCP